MFLKESLLLSLHTFLIFFIAFPLDLSPFSVNENADGCDAAGQQHIVCQQRRKRNDDEPYLIDKIDARSFFFRSRHTRNAALSRRSAKTRMVLIFINFFPLLMVLLLLQVPHKVGYLEKKGTLPSLSSKMLEKR